MGGGDYPGPGAYSVGSEVAGYRLEEQIGQGGMALVYRARDVQLGRNVALKLLSPMLGSDESFRERFIRESRAAAAVGPSEHHPDLRRGQSDGVLYIAMRFVQGGDVRQLVDQLGPLPGDRAAGIITQVASALDAAHLHGLVHRDIKPANMLLDSSGGNGEQDHVYLADFGLSKRSLSVTGLTSMGQFLGTPAYVAPEQVEGRAVDGRTDQYALACTAFEMLTGSPPFERDDDLAIMWAHVSAPPPALSEQRPDLPPAIDEVLRRAMAKSPADRYPSCLAFAAALRAALGLPGQPAARRPRQARARPWSPARRAGSGTPAHPPTQISHPGAAAAAGAGQAAFAEDEPSRAGEFTPPTAEATGAVARRGGAASLRIRVRRCARQRSGGPGVPADRGLGEPGTGAAPVTPGPSVPAVPAVTPVPADPGVTATGAAPARVPGPAAGGPGPVGRVPGRLTAGRDGHRGGSRCGGPAGPSWSAAWRWSAWPSGCSPRCTAAGARTTPPRARPTTTPPGGGGGRAAGPADRAGLPDGGGPGAAAGQSAYGSVAVGDEPFAVTTTADGKYTFVTARTRSWCWPATAAWPRPWTT